MRTIALSTTLVIVLAVSPGLAATPMESEAQALRIVNECMADMEIRGFVGQLTCVRKPYDACEASSGMTQRELSECASIMREAWRVRLAEQVERTRTYIGDRAAFDESQMEWEEWSGQHCDLFAYDSPRLDLAASTHLLARRM